MKCQTTKELEEKRVRNRAYEIPPDKLAVFDAATAELRASGIKENALKEGDKAPDFTLSDAHGRPCSLHESLSQGPVVLSFYRGGWCPYCNIELRGLQRALPEIQRLGASLVAISPELPDRSLSTEEKNQLTFAVLSDTGNRVARKFGIAFRLPDALQAVYAGLNHDLNAMNGAEGGEELPIPATYLIDRDSTIRLAFIEESYYERLDPDDIVEGLKKLK